MATKITLYNSALVELGAERLATITEQRKSREELDAVYDDVLSDCLSAGLWNFAMRSVKLVADSTITPNFGFTEVFDKPDDWVRTAAFTSDEDFTNPIPDHGYRDEVGFWAATQSPIYLQYVSDDSSYGGDLTLFPPTYRRFVEIALADRICLSVTQNAQDKERLERLALPKAKRNALSKDAMNEGAKYRRRGSWNDSRHTDMRNDRGLRTPFTGS
jgi:hypothetical protein